MESILAGPGEGQLTQNAAINGKGLTISAARGSRETQLDSIISQRPSQYHDPTMYMHRATLPEALTES